MTASDSKKSSRRGLAFSLLDDTLAICRLPPRSRIPRWAREGDFWCHAGSGDETSIVCAEAGVPEDVRHDGGWRALKIEGPLDFQLIGVIEAIVRPLTRKGVSLFAISTFDTDYVLVRNKNIERTIEILEEDGHRCTDPASADREADDSRRSGKPSKDSEERRERGRRPRPAAAAEEAPAEEVTERVIERRPRRSRDDDDRRRPTSRPAEKKDGGDERDDEARAEVEELEREVKSSRRPDRRKDGEESREKETADEPIEAAGDAEEVEDPEDTSEEERDVRRDGRRDRDGDRDRGPRRGRGRGREIPEDVTSEGLYAGAIAQAPLETTEQTFEGLGLSDPIIETITEIGFVHPTPIQVDAIPVALEGKDVIGLAETGSGKTAAFALPLAERLTHGKGVRGLILCPTREIALQTKAFLEIFGHDHALETAVVIGGVPMGPQIRHLSRHPDIIVATPGRIADHVRRRNVSLGKVERLVLDEADHMLDLGFLPQIQEILESVPDERQTMMFSATMPPEIARLASHFMRDPVTIDFRPEGRTAEGIEHRLYLVRREDQKECLFALLREVPGTTLIFIRRKVRTEWMARQLEDAGFTAERIHSDRSQAQRVDALRGFRSGDHRILVATDVAARGIDVPSIRHVVNFGVPDHVQDYVHRAGRTARGSADGIVSTIATPLEKGYIKEIELEIGQKLQRCKAEGVEAWKELKVKKRIRRRLL